MVAPAAACNHLISCLIHNVGIVYVNSVGIVRCSIVLEGSLVDGVRFDRITRQLVRQRLSRRAALQASGLGLTASLFRVGSSREAIAQGTPVACPPATANEVEIDGAWLCKQPYALCTTAPCQPSATDPTVSTCRCVVLDGYSMGYTSCQERVPVGRKLVSNFSTENVTDAFRVMTCPEAAPWANCLDMPCELDSLDPAQATCQCPIVASGPSFTFGGDCDTDTCTSVIWSGATPPGVTQYTAAMRCVNQAVTFPAICPSGTPTAPASPPAVG